MSTLALLGIGAGSIAPLLLLIIRWQVHAFVAMMLVSFLVAFATGMPIADIISTLIAGMGGTLGSVAILVALGSMLGRMIEVSAAQPALANRFTQLGPTRVPMALHRRCAGAGHPGVFDVGFIILVPIVYGFCKAAGVNPIKFGLPVAGHHAGRARGGATAPRHRGRAAIVRATLAGSPSLAWPSGIPLAALAQVVAGWLNRRGCPMLPTTAEQFAAFGSSAKTARHPRPAAFRAWHHHGADPDPLALIMAGTTGATLLPKGDSLRNAGLHWLAHLCADGGVGLAMLLLGRNQGWNRERTNAIMESALPRRHRDPGDRRWRRVCQGAHGQRHWRCAVANLTATHLPLILLAFIISLALRRPGASATVAIITTCGLLADAMAVAGIPLTSGAAHGCHWLWQLGLSHVNDSGFWIVTRYLGLSVGDGLRTWTTC